MGPCPYGFWCYKKVMIRKNISPNSDRTRSILEFKWLKPLKGLENVLLIGLHHANLQSQFPFEHYLDA